MYDRLAKSANGGGIDPSDENATLPTALRPATSHPSLQSTPKAQPGQGMVLELPRELRDMIWKQIHTFEEVVDFIGGSFYL